MAKIVPETNGLGKRGVYLKCDGDGSADLGNLYTVGKPVAVIIVNARGEDLRFSLEPSECFAVYDAVTIPLKG
jgi:hypothetical protein